MDLPILATDGCPENDALASRRAFLRRAVTVAIGTMSVTMLSVPTGDAESSEPAGGNSSGQPGEKHAVYGFLIDTDKCSGSGKCLAACRVENDVPEGCSRTWVERYVHFKDGSFRIETIPEMGYNQSNVPAIDPDDVLRSYFVPKLCNHCENPPCNQVCPVHAAFTSPEGFVLVDPKRCIGCAYCVQACPYGARFINHDTGTADKCTWCYHRVKKGEQPACVESCPTGARMFGRLDDPNSEIRKRLGARAGQVLKEHLGTHPQTQYVTLSQEVR